MNRPLLLCVPAMLITVTLTAQLSISNDPNVQGFLKPGQPAPAAPLAIPALNLPGAAASTTADQRMAAAVQAVNQRVSAGQLPEALGAASEALRIAEADFGKESLMVARRRMDIATVLRMGGNSLEAMDWAEKAVGLEQKVGDANGADYALSVQRLGEIYLDVAQDAAALNAFTKSYEVLKAKLPEDDPALVTAVHNLGVAFFQTGKRECVGLLEKALAMREKAGGGDSIPVAMTSWMLGRALFHLKDFARGEKLIRRALDIFRKHEQQQAAMVTRTLDDLALLLIESGELTKAEAVQRENEETTARLFGENHPLRLGLLQRRGELHRARGETEEAEKYFVRAFEFHTSQYGEKSGGAVNANLYLAQFYEQTGRLEKAEKHYLQGLQTVEAAAGAESGLALNLHIKLADFYFNTMNDLPKAEATYRRGLAAATRGQIGVPLHVRMQIARICMISGRRDEAATLLQALLREAQEMGEKGAAMADAARIALSELRADGTYLTEMIRHNEEFLTQMEAQQGRSPSDNVKIAEVCLSIADPCLAAARAPDAEKWSRRALEICQTQCAPTHDLTRRARMALIWSLHDQKRDKEAQPHLQRWMEGESKRMEAMLSFGTAEQRLRWLAGQFSCELPVSLGLARETATLLLHTKGIAFDFMLAERREAEAAMTEEGRTLWAQIVDLRAQLRREFESPKPSAEFAGLQQRYAQASDRLSQLGGVRNTLRDTLQSTVEQVQEKLPEDAALLDFFCIPVRDRGGKWVSRYGMVVLRRGREPKLFTTKHTRTQVDEMARYFRASMQQTGSAKKKDEALEALHHAFYEMVLESAEGELEGVKTLYLCPDGTLQFVPFATLLDRKGRFLTERFDIRHLTSARDLLREIPSSKAAAQRSIALFGGASYKLGAKAPDVREASATEKARVADFLSERNAALITPLPGTQREIEFITARASDSGWAAQVFRGDGATEEQLRALAAPQCLHVATHGYFLTTAFEVAAAKLEGQRVADSRKPDHSGILDPSLDRAGVLLAGAEDSIALWRQGRANPQDRDGVLNAGEVSELGLGGTHLVVLSACDSGAGGGIVSTGVLGLRTAFLRAGARHVVSTLWPIPDAETADLMGAFYKRYFETGKPCASLHETQRDWLVRVRKSQGLWQAVQQAGAFMLLSTGAEE